MRLGLVLAEIGQRAGVTVDEKDLTEAVVERARQFPGQEKQIWDFYRNNEQALASLRAPIYEERVVAHLSGLVKIADKTVTREELFAEDEEDADLTDMAGLVPAIRRRASSGVTSHGARRDRTRFRVL